ncbi:MAG: PLP-dependent aspartate aminotransferase family protein [Bacillota bacterium]|nr:PLP-dependent aspartate aminotransferase family protein [Bacillota bacterium]
MAYTVETKCLHQEDSDNIENAYGAISFPIYQTATFAHRGVGESTGYDYSRLQNPTREQLEKTVASLEKGIDAIAFSSGMSAIAAVMELFRPGDHVIADADLYGGSVRLFQKISEKNGIVFSRADLSSEDVQQYITENTKAIYIETPTNPMMHVTDIRKLSEIAKAHQLLVIVDNTFMSPYFQNPLELGADIVVHSGTKYLNGHNDVIAGFTVTADQELAEKLRFIFKTTGACLAPFDSWLVLRGIKTLALRMEKAQENAVKLARWLEGKKQVTKVIYPGLESHPGYELMKRQSRGFGAMITFEVKSSDLAKSILRRVKLIQFAESLGGTETLITYPVTQTHADVPEKEREKNGITDRILRISTGIEGAEDLIRDLEQAFEADE